MTDPAASAIRNYLESQRPAMLKFVEELVNIESYATQPGGTNAVGDRLCRELETIGYTTERTRGNTLPPDRKWLEEFMLPSFDRSLLGAVEPVSATLFATLWLGTAFTGADLAGCALMIAMIFLVTGEKPNVRQDGAQAVEESHSAKS